MVRKGYVIQADTAVLIPLGSYRQVRNKLTLADSLINSGKQRIEYLSNSNELLTQKNNNLSQVNILLSGQVKDLNKANIDLLGKYEEAVDKKWYQRPEIYGIAGLIVGVFIAR